MTRLIDADKLYPDCVTKKGTLAISQNQIANAPTVEYPFYAEAYQTGYEEGKNETWKDDDLCETCRYGDTCGQSDKGVPFAKHSKCWKYRCHGGRQ